MFRPFWPTVSSVLESKLELVCNRGVVPNRMQLPAHATAADAAAINSKSPHLTVDGGRVTKLFLDCDPSNEYSACAFCISNPHDFAM